MIKTFENFNLTNIYKHIDPRNILYKLRKFGIECKYKVSIFDRYKDIFYSTSPIPKELEIDDKNSVKLYKNNVLVYEIYTEWEIDNYGDYHNITMLKVIVANNLHLNLDIDPYGEEEWDDNIENENKIICRNYEDALNKVLDLEKKKL